MPELVHIIRTAGIIIGRGLATYAGIKFGDNLGNSAPQAYMIPELVQGISAFLLGTIGNRASRILLGDRGISEEEAYSIAALNAFAKLANDARNLTTTQSLEEISIILLK